MAKQLETTAVKMQVETLQLSSHRVEHRCYLWAEIDPHLTRSPVRDLLGAMRSLFPVHV